MRVLAIGAHPDDIEYGCGGTLRKLATMGHQVHMVVLTAGEAGGVPEERKKEQQQSAAILGVHECQVLDLADTKVPVSREVIGLIDDHVSRLCPEYIFSHFFNDTHQDHRSIAQAMVSATRNARKVLYFEGPTSQFFTPSVFVDITDSIDAKVDALQAHQSQVYRTNIESTSIVEMARATAIFRGTQARVKFAEAFVPVRLFLDFPVL